MPFCAEGTFYDIKRKLCQKCNLQKCIACYGNEDVCTICPDDDNYVGVGGCRGSCDPDGYKRQGSDQLRLVPIPGTSILYGNRSRGLVEMYVDDRWMPLCGFNWNIQTAAVVCHELGYGDPIRIFSLRRYVLSFNIGKIQKVNCSGTEKTISECTKSMYFIKYLLTGILFDFPLL